MNKNDDDDGNDDEDEDDDDDSVNANVNNSNNNGITRSMHHGNDNEGDANMPHDLQPRWKYFHRGGNITAVEILSPRWKYFFT